MSDNKLTKDVYLQYAKKIVSVLSGDEFYHQFKKRVDEGMADFKLVKKRLIQDISIDWIATIEDCLPNLDNIVRNPRRFIVQEEDIVDVSLARAISTESIKHLAQHTNMISKVEDDGTVTPNRILNITKEESFEIYENRFIFTLLLKLKDFVSMRYDKIKKASATQDVLQLNVDSKFNLPSKKVTYRTEYMAQLSFDEIMRLDNDTLEKIERIAKIDRIVTDFLSSSFAKSMRNSAPVRPPITRTNVILKEPNFKKALTLWQFIETYQATGGFSTSDDIEDYKITKDSQLELREMVTLNTMLFESLYDQHETDMNMEDAAFTDLLRVGDLDFGKDELEHDEYSQKLDEEELTDEAEKEEEVKPVEDENQEVEEEDKQEEPPEPEIEIEEEEVEKEVDKDVEIEAPPKEEPDFEEPDAEQFDQNLFDVRKLFKRPDDDKLKQEEISRVKDAIDRCLVSYRKIKQEELDEKDRQHSIRRRAEELRTRAEIFRLENEELARQTGQVYLGNEGFKNQSANTVLPSKSVNFVAEHKDLFPKKNEKLDFTDNDLHNIRTRIEEMERLKHKEQSLRINFAGDGRVEPIDESDLPVVNLDERVRVKERVKRIRTATGALSDGEERNLLGATDYGSAEVGYIDSRKEKDKRIVEVEPVVKPLKPKGSAVKRTRVIKPVDENKVQVGDAPVHGKDAFDLLDDTFGDQRAKLGNLNKNNKPSKKTNKNTAETVYTNEQTKAVEVKIEETKTDAVEPSKEMPKVSKEPVKPKIRKSEPLDPWALSPTTLNQKYDTPQGRNRTFGAIDENKVKVGDVPVKSVEAGDLLDDTFAEQRANLGKLGTAKKQSKPKKTDSPNESNEDNNT